MARPVDQVTERRTTGDDRSLGELFSDLSRETTTLVRQEVALAKAELSQKAAQAGKDVGFLAAGGAVAYAGFLALVAALIIGLGQAGLSWWVSALLVGIVVAAIGGALVWTGIQQLRNLNPTPTQTIESLKENQAWTKDQIS
ncbi:MAG TPA: phage holin family protein [Chloroflexota bacterium]|nr:phage holin family protein [Chloroflexota bacterium]